MYNSFHVCSTKIQLSLASVDIWVMLTVFLEISAQRKVFITQVHTRVHLERLHPDYRIIDELNNLSGSLSTSKKCCGNCRNFAIEQLRKLNGQALQVPSSKRVSHPHEGS
jgi:hypothetical protein